MTKAKRDKMMRMVRYKQKLLNQVHARLIVAHLLILLMILFIALIRTSQNNQIEGRINLTVYESYDDHNTVILPATVLSDEVK